MSTLDKVDTQFTLKAVLVYVYFFNVDMGMSSFLNVTYYMFPFFNVDNVCKCIDKVRKLAKSELTSKLRALFPTLICKRYFAEIEDVANN